MKAVQLSRSGEILMIKQEVADAVRKFLKVDREKYRETPEGGRTQPS